MGSRPARLFSRAVALLTAGGVWFSRAVAVLTAGGVWALSVSAVAQAPSRRPLVEALSLEANPRECIDPSSLAARVAKWLHRDRIDARITLRVRVPGRDGLKASFTVEWEGERMAKRGFGVFPDTCDARLDALALAMAMAVEHTLRESGAATATGHAAVDRGATTRAAGDAASGASPPSPARDAQPPRTELRGVLSGSASWGLVPGPAAGGEIALELAVGESPAFVARAGALVTQQVRASLGAGAFEVRLVAGRVDACLEGAWPRVHVGGCAGLVAGAALVDGVNFMDNRHTTRPGVAATAGVRLQFPLGSRVAIGWVVEAHTHVLRPRVVVRSPDGDRLAQRTFPVAGGVTALELVVRFP